MTIPNPPATKNTTQFNRIAFLRGFCWNILAAAWQGGGAESIHPTLQALGLMERRMRTNSLIQDSNLPAIKIFRLDKEIIPPINGGVIYDSHPIQDKPEGGV
jgi:hypothetical protein